MLEEVFATRSPIIGVIHLLPLPGSPRWDGKMEPILERAEQEAAALATGGVDGIIIENFFDAPFTRGRVDTATACAMALVARRVMSICELPLGINVLRNDGHTAIAVATTTGAQFIRVNVFTGAMVTDQGIIEGEAHELLLYKRQLGAQSKIKILADVLVKHAEPLASASNIGQIAKDTVMRGLADAVIVSGIATGAGPDLDEVRAVREALPDTPLLIGSGTTRENIRQLLAIADGVIVGTALKRQGLIENPIDVERVRSLVESAQQVRA